MSHILNKLILHKKPILYTYGIMVGSFTLAGMIDGANTYYYTCRKDTNSYVKNYMEVFRLAKLSDMTQYVIIGGINGVCYGTVSPITIPIYSSVYCYNKIKEYNEKKNFEKIFKNQ